MDYDELPRATAQNLKMYKELEKEMYRLQALLKTDEGYAAHCQAAEEAAAQLETYHDNSDWFDYTFEEDGKEGLTDISGRGLIPPL